MRPLGGVVSAACSPCLCDSFGESRKHSVFPGHWVSLQARGRAGQEVRRRREGGGTERSSRGKPQRRDAAHGGTPRSQRLLNCLPPLVSLPFSFEAALFHLSGFARRDAYGHRKANASGTLLRLAYAKKPAARQLASCSPSANLAIPILIIKKTYQESP